MTTIPDDFGDHVNNVFHSMAKAALDSQQQRLDAVIRNLLDAELTIESRRIREGDSMELVCQMSMLLMDVLGDANELGKKLYEELVGEPGG